MSIHEMVDEKKKKVNQRAQNFSDKGVKSPQALCTDFPYVPFPTMNDWERGKNYTVLTAKYYPFNLSVPKITICIRK